MKKKHTLLCSPSWDKQVIDLLHEGEKTNAELRRLLPWAVVDKSLGTSPFLDKVLQGLRKGGFISVKRGKWSLMSRKPCPRCSGKGWIEK